MAQLEPQLMDERTDNLSESENTETHMTSEVEPETDKESPEIPEKTSSDVKKENTKESVKRSTSTKRTTNPITSSGAKVTTSSVNRNAASSKPSSKTASVSSVRRSTVQSTAPSIRHTSSAYSSGGSGDEKRKSLISATRRTSLTPISQHQTVKLESLAEKRGISGVTARKSTTSANSVSQKPIARSNSTTSKSASIIKRSSSVNTKSSTSGTLSDSTKRLSTAPGSIITAKQLARNSSVSTEVDRLKVQLELSATKIDDQDKEIKATLEKVDKITKQLEEEIHKSTLIEEKLKTEYREKTEKLETDHETKLQILQSELEKSQSAVVDAQEILKKSIEEAVQKEALKNVNIVQELKDGFESMLSSLNTQLSDSKANCASLASKLSEKESEIQSLNSQIIKIDEQQKILQQEHEKSISNLQQSLLEEKEAALSILRTEFNELALKQDNQMKSTQDKETAALAEKYELKLNELQTALDNTKASLAEAEETHKKILETNFNESEIKISSYQSEISQLKSEFEANSASLLASVKSKKDLEENYESSEMILKTTRQEYAGLSEKFKELENQHSIESQELIVARDELAQVKAQLAKQIQMMQTFNDDAKSKDESYKKMESELVAATKKLNENENEIDNFKKKLEETEKTSLSYEEIITKLQEELATKEEAKFENNEKVKHYESIISDKSRELSEAENNYKSQLRLLEDKILEARNEACQELKAAHLKESQDMEASHLKSLSDLQQDHTNFKLESSSIIGKLQATSMDLEKQLGELKNELAKTQKELATNQQYLAQEKMEKAQALAELDAVQSRKLDTIETKNFISNQQEQTTREEAESDQIMKTAFEDLSKLKDAEISETKIASSQDGITHNKLTPLEMNTLEENDGEQDNSSAALASLAQAMALAHQVTQMINEFQNDIFGPLRTLAETSPKPIFNDENFTKEV